MRRIACAAVFITCAILAAGQDKGVPNAGKSAGRREPPPGPLRSVTIKGNRLYSSEAIIRETGLRAGQQVSGAIIEEARKKLQDSELFNNVADEYRFEGSPLAYTLTFVVTENEQLFPMRFERLPVSAAVIQDYQKAHLNLYADRIPGTKGVLKRYT